MSSEQRKVSEENIKATARLLGLNAEKMKQSEIYLCTLIFAQIQLEVVDKISSDEGREFQNNFQTASMAELDDLSFLGLFKPLKWCMMAMRVLPPTLVLERGVSEETFLTCVRKLLSKYIRACVFVSRDNLYRGWLNHNPQNCWRFLKKAMRSGDWEGEGHFNVLLDDAQWSVVQDAGFSPESQTQLKRDLNRMRLFYEREIISYVVGRYKEENGIERWEDRLHEFTGTELGVGRLTEARRQFTEHQTYRMPKYRSVKDTEDKAGVDKARFYAAFDRRARDPRFKEGRAGEREWGARYCVALP